MKEGYIYVALYKAARRLLVTDLITLNHGQVTRMTPKNALPSPNFHTTPTGGRLSLVRFNAQLHVLRDGSSAATGSNS
ncbi:hypothetical protein TNCV_3731501 [Trichonephila clavipes]|nr:hypothetical protein TNCV_3731501 [Trichonephila clavipes]